MGIRIVDDVGAPVVVTVVDLVTQASAPTWNSWANYGMTAIGYGAAFLNYGGDFVKNIGIASLPKTLELLYAMVVTPAAYHVPAPAPASHFARMAQTQVPGFGGIHLV